MRLGNSGWRDSGEYEFESDTVQSRIMHRCDVEDGRIKCSFKYIQMSNVAL